MQSVQQTEVFGSTSSQFRMQKIQISHSINKEYSLFMLWISPITGSG